MTDVGKSETTQYNYDANDRMTGVIEPNSNTVTYAYDNTDNLTSLTNRIGTTDYLTTYQYDILQQLTKVSFGSSWSKAIYDENGNMAGTVKSNNTKSYFSYDDAGRIKNLKLLKGNSNNLGNYTYTYDGNSNITQVALSGDSFGSKTVNYTYDALNRLTSETLRDGTLIEYTYDAVGNRLTKTVTPQGGGGSTTTNYTNDVANQLTTVNSTSYSYDDNGNMTSDGSRNFEYDAANRLTRVTNIANGSLIASFEYDGDGRRTSKTTPGGITKYFYDGDSTNVLYETDGSGTLLARYIYGKNGQIVSMIRGTSTYFYHYNGHGDVVALTDSNGVVVAEYDYDAWGNPVSTGLGGTVVNPYRYAGYRWDSETGMYYLNARYYLPSVGRFINRDSIHGFEEDPQTLNLYSYCKGNPVMNVDPTGHIANGWWNSTGFVGNVIDALIIAISAGQSIAGYYAAKAFLKKNKNKVVYQIRGKILSMFGKPVALGLVAVVDIALTLVGSSVGQLIAKALDYADSWWGYRRSNGYILG